MYTEKYGTHVNKLLFFLAHRELVSKLPWTDDAYTQTDKNEMKTINEGAQMHIHNVGALLRHIHQPTLVVTVSAKTYHCKSSVE